jgi:hypothetical protein
MQEQKSKVQTSNLFDTACAFTVWTTYKHIHHQHLNSSALHSPETMTKSQNFTFFINIYVPCIIFQHLYRKFCDVLARRHDHVHVLQVIWSKTISIKLFSFWWCVCLYVVQIVNAHDHGRIVLWWGLKLCQRGLFDTIVMLSTNRARCNCCILAKFLLMHCLG